MKRARKLIRFNATGTVKKDGSAKREVGEETLFVAESTRRKEATKEGRKRKNGTVAEDRGIL